MSEPFLAEIRIMSFAHPPKGWAWCNGQLMPINQNQALFALLSTNYGGNGQTTFALPNLQGRTPIHRSDTHPLGQSAGAISHTLQATEMPTHSHALSCVDADATTRLTAGNIPAYGHDESYGPVQPANLAVEALEAAGASQPHNNMQPYLALSFCIALQGIFPSET
jgi:microcystin-dependent protein